MPKWYTQTISASTVEPVATSDVVAQLNLPSTQTDDNTLIAGFIKRARHYCEHRIPGGKSLLPTRTIDWIGDDFPGGDQKLKLPYPPLKSITSITYYPDGSTTTSTLDNSTDIRLFTPTHTVGWIEPLYDADWPSTEHRTDAVTVRYVAGTTDVAETVKHAMLLLCGHWYTNREAAVMGSVPKEMEFSVTDLLASDGYGFYGAL